MPISPPKIVVPLCACSDRVRLQGQETGATVKIYASPNNILDKVFEGVAHGPDETFVLSRRLKAGEQVTASQELPGDSPGYTINPEVVGPEPDISELGPVTADTHLHTCGQCAAFGNALPGATVEVSSTTRGPLGNAVVDPGEGAARVHFSSPLQDQEILQAVQSICGKNGPITALPRPDRPQSDQRLIPTPSLQPPLHACERAVFVSKVSEGAVVKLFRDNAVYASACFDYAQLWFRIADPLKDKGAAHPEMIAVQQAFPTCELLSNRSPNVPVLPADAPTAPRIIGPLCKGMKSIPVTELSFGAKVQIVQTSGSFQMSSLIAEAEAWDITCDIPLIDSLDPVRGKYAMAVKILCNVTSPPSEREEIHKVSGVFPPPAIQGPVFDCSRVVRVKNIHRGARVEIYMSCVNPPYWRMLAAPYIYGETADILVTPGLLRDQKVFARQIACGQTSDSATQRVLPIGDLNPPTIEDCGDHLEVTSVVAGARVEVYLNGAYFRSGRSGGETVVISLDAPLAAGTVIKARQLLCSQISSFSPDFTVRDDVVKRNLTWVSTTRISQLTGNTDPEGKLKLSNSVPAGIKETDLGIVVDNDTGDNLLYFFFGDTGVTDDAEDFPDGGDCMASTGAWSAGANGPTLNFLHDNGDDGPVPFALTIDGITLGIFEVPTGGFSHAGKLYVFASTGHYTDNPITHGLFKDNNFMGRSVLASALNARDHFQIVPGHDDISNHIREATGGFKFINIAPWKIQNDDWPHLPDNAVVGQQGLILIGSGRYRESQPCLAYVPLSSGQDPKFNDWRYLSGFGPRTQGSGPCGVPQWSDRQRDAIFLFDDSPFFQGNPGVVGELSVTFCSELGRWLLLYGGVVMRSADFPWGPWGDPVPLFDYGRDHANLSDPTDTRPRFIQPDGGTYGPYIVPRFTEWDRFSRQATIYYTMSTWRPYQVMLMQTVVQLNCGYDANFKCAQ